MDYAIIVAGGSGTRMGTHIPKQFLEVGGKPVLMRTIERFYEYDKSLNIIVVLPHGQQDYWFNLCDKYQFTINHNIIDGGKTRFISVKNGLKDIPDNEQGLVAIHDGVRPFVSRTTIGRCFDKASTDFSAIPVLPLTDTLMYIGKDTPPINILRDNFRLAQTPQVFNIKLIKKAYNRQYKETFTDDASVVENAGLAVAIVEGNPENIKITTPFDLLIAETIINKDLI